MTELSKSFSLTVSPDVGFDSVALSETAFRAVGLLQSPELEMVITRRSIDARKRDVKVHIEGRIELISNLKGRINFKKPVRRVGEAARRVCIVGAGPAGLFAALRLIEVGIKPIVFERGKEVRARRFDLVSVNKKGFVNPNSNYCFGEGGAGTFSDGKLYTRASKRGDVRRILEIFHVHGATDSILYDAHPHIGTNLLPGIVVALRETIRECGGEIHFESRVVDLDLEGVRRVRGVKLDSGEWVKADAVMLATGHSARDIFELLRSRSVLIEAKPFALGVRVEHRQALIDSIQYHCESRGRYLPAASYNLVTQTQLNGVERGAFSFCMCPGGFIVPAMTAPGEIVVNGMSPSRRDSVFSNSGVVVSVDAEDFKEFSDEGPLAGLAFQASVERRAFEVSGLGFSAPAQRLTDFVAGRVSSSLIETSYQPGVVSRDLSEVLPESVAIRLRDAFAQFGRKMKGYMTQEALVLGVESRTSSPVRIPRDSKTLEHLQVECLFPVAEGAGYAGGIVSAAMDGERAALAVARKVST